MQLADLDPTFYGDLAGRKGLGITFDCPLCVAAGVRAEVRGLISVPFKNPLDGGPPTPNGKGCTWQRTGLTFADLTLTPSIDASSSLCGGGTHPGWHGFVTNGRVA